jgi:hypothetical protein
MMSLADFNDIYSICLDWDTEDVFEDIIMQSLIGRSSDSLTFTVTSRTNRWGEMAEKELESLKRDPVLV